MSHVASDTVFGGVLTLMLDLGQQNMYETSNLFSIHTYRKSRT